MVKYIDRAFNFEVKSKKVPFYGNILGHTCRYTYRYFYLPNYCITCLLETSNTSLVTLSDITGKWYIIKHNFRFVNLLLFAIVILMNGTYHIDIDTCIGIVIPTVAYLLYDIGTYIMVFWIPKFLLTSQRFQRYCLGYCRFKIIFAKRCQ